MAAAAPGETEAPRREEPDARGGKFDSQGQAVETTANPGHGGDVFVGEGEVG